MPMKCTKCRKEAEYIYDGHSLCQKHLDERINAKILVLKDPVESYLKERKVVA